jgi:RNA polymerase-binding transcription factor DksA
VIDPADKASDDEARAMALFEQQHRQLYRAPEGAFPSAALNCLDCGEIIPEERVRAMPRTVRCADCAADVERRWNR